MIEQTELIITKWQYNPPMNSVGDCPEKLYVGEDSNWMYAFTDCHAKEIQAII